MEFKPALMDCGEIVLIQMFVLMEQQQLAEITIAGFKRVLTDNGNLVQAQMNVLMERLKIVLVELKLALPELGEIVLKAGYHSSTLMQRQA
jgi:hypothetical protein